VRAGTVPGGLARNREFYGPAVDATAVETAWRDALFDPQTSGGLLVALPSRRTAAFRAALRRRRVWHVEAGEVVARTTHAVVLSPS
jgi:selenide,water dikinase